MKADPRKPFLEKNECRQLRKFSNDTPQTTETGLIVYAVIVIVLTMFISMILGGLFHGILDVIGANTNIAGYSMFVLLPVTGIALTVFAVRDFHRRAGISVIFFSNRIGVVSERNNQVRRHEEISSLQIVPGWTTEICELVGTDGSRLRLPGDIAGFSTIRETIEKTVLPKLVDRVSVEIEAGKEITVRESFIRAGMRIPFGLSMIVFGSLMCLTIKYVVFGAALIRNGRRQMRLGWHGIGRNIMLNSEGVTDRSGSRGWCEHWEALETIDVSDFGFVVKFRSGSQFSASPFAENFWIASGILSRRVDEHTPAPIN